MGNEVGKETESAEVSDIGAGEVKTELLRSKSQLSGANKLTSVIDSQLSQLSPSLSTGSTETSDTSLPVQDKTRKKPSTTLEAIRQTKDLELTDEEREHINQVLSRVRQLEQQEDARITKLRGELQLSEQAVKRRVSISNQDMTAQLSVCILCGRPKRKGSSSTDENDDQSWHTCADCENDVCNFCGSYFGKQPEEGRIWLCNLCQKKRRLAATSGQWLEDSKKLPEPPKKFRNLFSLKKPFARTASFSKFEDWIEQADGGSQSDTSSQEKQTYLKAHRRYSDNRNEPSGVESKEPRPRRHRTSRLIERHSKPLSDRLPDTGDVSHLSRGRTKENAPPEGRIDLSSAEEAQSSSAEADSTSLSSSKVAETENSPAALVQAEIADNTSDADEPSLSEQSHVRISRREEASKESSSKSLICGIPREEADSGIPAGEHAPLSCGDLAATRVIPVDRSPTHRYMPKPPNVDSAPVSTSYLVTEQASENVSNSASRRHLYASYNSAYSENEDEHFDSPATDLSKSADTSILDPWFGTEGQLEDANNSYPVLQAKTLVQTKQPAQNTKKTVESRASGVRDLQSGWTATTREGGLKPLTVITSATEISQRNQWSRSPVTTHCLQYPTVESIWSSEEMRTTHYPRSVRQEQLSPPKFRRSSGPSEVSSREHPDLRDLVPFEQNFLDPSRMNFYEPRYSLPAICLTSHPSASMSFNTATEGSSFGPLREDSEKLSSPKMDLPAVHHRNSNSENLTDVQQFDTDRPSGEHELLCYHQNELQAVSVAEKSCALIDTYLPKYERPIITEVPPPPFCSLTQTTVTCHEATSAPLSSSGLDFTSSQQTPSSVHQNVSPAPSTMASGPLCVRGWDSQQIVPPNSEDSRIIHEVMPGIDESCHSVLKRCPNFENISGLSEQAIGESDYQVLSNLTPVVSPEDECRQPCSDDLDYYLQLEDEPTRVWFRDSMRNPQITVEQDNHMLSSLRSDFNHYFQITLERDSIDNEDLLTSLQQEDEIWAKLFSPSESVVESAKEVAEQLDLMSSASEVVGPLEKEVMSFNDLNWHSRIPANGSEGEYATLGLKSPRKSYSAEFQKNTALFMEPKDQSPEKRHPTPVCSTLSVTTAQDSQTTASEMSTSSELKHAPSVTRLKETPIEKSTEQSNQRKQSNPSEIQRSGSGDQNPTVNSETAFTSSAPSNHKKCKLDSHFTDTIVHTGEDKTNIQDTNVSIIRTANKEHFAHPPTDKLDAAGHEHVITSTANISLADFVYSSHPNERGSDERQIELGQGIHPIPDFGHDAKMSTLAMAAAQIDTELSPIGRLNSNHSPALVLDRFVASAPLAACLDEQEEKPVEDILTTASLTDKSVRCSDASAEHKVQRDQSLTSDESGDDWFGEEFVRSDNKPIYPFGIQPLVKASVGGKHESTSGIVVLNSPGTPSSAVNEFEHFSPLEKLGLRAEYSLSLQLPCAQVVPFYLLDEPISNIHPEHLTPPTPRQRAGSSTSKYGLILARNTLLSPRPVEQDISCPYLPILSDPITSEAEVNSVHSPDFYNWQNVSAASQPFLNITCFSELSCCTPWNSCPYSIDTSVITAGVECDKTTTYSENLIPPSDLESPTNLSQSAFTQTGPSSQTPVQLENSDLCLTYSPQQGSTHCGKILRQITEEASEDDSSEKSTTVATVLQTTSSSVMSCSSSSQSSYITRSRRRPRSSSYAHEAYRMPDGPVNPHPSYSLPQSTTYSNRYSSGRRPQRSFRDISLGGEINGGPWDQDADLTPTWSARYQTERNYTGIDDNLDQDLPNYRRLMDSYHRSLNRLGLVDSGEIDAYDTERLSKGSLRSQRTLAGFKGSKYLVDPRYDRRQQSLRSSHPKSGHYGKKWQFKNVSNFSASDGLDNSLSNWSDESGVCERRSYLSLPLNTKRFRESGSLTSGRRLTTPFVDSSLLKRPCSLMSGRLRSRPTNGASLSRSTEYLGPRSQHGLGFGDTSMQTLRARLAACHSESHLNETGDTFDDQLFETRAQIYGSLDRRLDSDNLMTARLRKQVEKQHRQLLRSLINDRPSDIQWSPNLSAIDLQPLPYLSYPAASALLNQPLPAPPSVSLDFTNNREQIGLISSTIAPPIFSTATVKGSPGPGYRLLHDLKVDPSADLSTQLGSLLSQDAAVLQGGGQAFVPEGTNQWNTGINVNTGLSPGQVNPSGFLEQPVANSQNLLDLLNNKEILQSVANNPALSSQLASYGVDLNAPDTNQVTLAAIAGAMAATAMANAGILDGAEFNDNEVPWQDLDSGVIPEAEVNLPAQNDQNIYNLTSNLPSSEYAAPAPPAYSAANADTQGLETLLQQLQNILATETARDLNNTVSAFPTDQNLQPDSQRAHMDSAPVVNDTGYSQRFEPVTVSVQSPESDHERSKPRGPSEAVDSWLMPTAAEGCRKPPLTNDANVEDSVSQPATWPSFTPSHSRTPYTRPEIKRTYGFPTKRLLIMRDSKDRGHRASGIGMRIVGGHIRSDGKLGAFVEEIYPHGPADQLHGEIREGDEILEWNSISLVGRTFEEVQSIISQVSEETELLVRARDDPRERERAEPWAISCSNTDYTKELEKKYTPKRVEALCHHHAAQQALIDMQHPPLCPHMQPYYMTMPQDDPYPRSVHPQAGQSGSTGSDSATSNSRNFNGQKATSGASETSSATNVKERPPSRGHRNPQNSPKTISSLESSKGTRGEQNKTPNRSPRSRHNTQNECESEPIVSSKQRESKSHEVIEDYGEIELIITFDDYDQSLTVHVSRARGLPPMDLNGLADPFVKIRLHPDPTEDADFNRQTKYTPNTLDPEWQQTVVFMNCFKRTLKRRVLEVTVWDFDRLKTNDFMGQALINLGDKHLVDGRPHWYNLHRMEPVIIPSARKTPPSRTGGSSSESVRQSKASKDSGEKRSVSGRSSHRADTPNSRRQNT
ncbi:unnamed protein product [Calicophoron daubneyi]|uniref:Uncharacterized protein n=1 Tax=Calicophoron daubneyi TaxID=300641 RepID=A0AAV2TJ43_CALDB